MFDSLRAAWLRVGRWPRLLAAATCLLLAALSATGAARDRAAAHAPAPTVPVVVATHALAAGRVISATDVRVARWPRSLHPPGTPSGVRAVVGRRCAGALSADEPLTTARLLGPGITTGLVAGLGALPIEVATGRSVDYVRAGDHVDVLAGPADSQDSGAPTSRSASDAELVAGDATVLSVSPGGDGQAAVVVIAADRSTALRVAREQSARTFTVVLMPP